MRPRKSRNGELSGRWLAASFKYPLPLRGSFANVAGQQAPLQQPAEGFRACCSTAGSGLTVLECLAMPCGFCPRTHNLSVCLGGAPKNCTKVYTPQARNFFRPYTAPILPAAVGHTPRTQSCKQARGRSNSGVRPELGSLRSEPHSMHLQRD